ncbi:MAG: hypothetical protein ACM3SV_04140 [Betaproteobacteria bacterium]
MVLVIAGLVVALVYVGRAAPKKPEESKPITSIQSLTVPSAELLAQKQAAEAKKQELLQMHARVLQSDSTGVIPDFPKLKALPKPALSPEAAPAVPAAGKKPGDPPAKVEAEKTAATEKPKLTPLGSEGLGVSSENLGGLVPAIEAMNAMDRRKKKPQEK